MSSWINIKELGAKGDGETDDTKIFQDTIAKYRNIYVPQGWYRITETIKMASNTCLIGLHPFATQLRLDESSPAFSGFGPPKPLLESSEGSNNIFTGIGINTGGYNYRAVGCKWMAGAGSLLNDVKFVGGHGTMQKGPLQPYNWNRNIIISSPESPVNAPGKDLAWDTEDNLLVVFRYNPQPGYMVDGKQETVPVLPDDNPGYSGWGNGGWASWAYAIDPENPDETFQPLSRMNTKDIQTVSKAMYPSSRWRYDFDDAIAYFPETCFVAPDQVTVIPETYDLGRSAALSAAYPGKPLYISDESLKRIVKLNVADNGRLSDNSEQAL